VSVVTDGSMGQPLSAVRRARWLLVALHIPAVAVAPVNVITGLVGQPRDPAAAVLAVLAALGVGGLQLRHSFAAARGRHPPGWRWTGLALVVLVYVPMVWFTWNWAAMQWFVVASALMLLRGWPAGILAAAPIVATAVIAGVLVAVVDRGSAAAVAFFGVYWLVGLVVGGVGLYGTARLVRVLEELDVSRAELAELAVGRERLRVSRDLHDLLGQSLSAVSLKGDLAIRLLGSDPQAAQAEIEGLTGVARDALRGVRAVTRDQHAVSLRTETEGAAALLQAAGVQVQLDVHLPVLPAATEQVLAWAVREGVTNVLRHSHASTCSITAARRVGTVCLEIVNDGVRASAGRGSGLDGLAERARALAGSVSHERTGDGRFRLLVEVPEEAA
jgi:two-component system sensor histidine kinase DesK